MKTVTRRELIARRMQIALKQAGMTTTELARQMGVAQPTAWRWISGGMAMKPDKLSVFAEIVGKRLSWFYEDEDETSIPLPPGITIAGLPELLRQVADLIEISCLAEPS